MTPNRGRVELFTFESKLLAKNPLGDPATRTTPVYLPALHDKEPDRRFPVIYVLSGFTGGGRTMLNVPPFDEPLPDRFDRLIGEGKMPAVIAVMPDCMTRNGGSQYVDSEGTGLYGSYLTEELIPEVDRRYRTIASRSSRAVVGKSSGGFGALVLAMDHPELFVAAGSHSGDCYFDHCYAQDFPRVVRELRKRGGASKYLEGFPSIEVKEKDDVFLINILAMSQCYSPNAEKPLPVNFDLPFDEETGELRPEVFARWKRWDPAERCKERAVALQTLKALFIDAGEHDEFYLDLGARILSKRLEALGVKHTLELYRGGHFNVQKRYDVSLPLLARALEVECKPGGSGLTSLRRRAP